MMFSLSISHLRNVQHRQNICFEVVQNSYQPEQFLLMTNIWSLKSIVFFAGLLVS